MPAILPPRLTLVLGGARSGKSRYAEGLVAAHEPPWVYLATAQALDGEMRDRIGHHRQRRDARWRTVEAPTALAAALAAEAKVKRPVLVDCLTLWLSNVLLAQQDVEAECDRLLAVMGERGGPLVVVSNEIGLGIVPDTRLGRTFRDAQGRLNQRVAAMADQVILMVAGIPLTVR
jgi:adenosylcobinamide kinase/adenosylcobinamide-phosphate guanylyltransferase